MEVHAHALEFAREMRQERCLDESKRREEVQQLEGG